MADDNDPMLSNIRDYLGWIVGLRVVEVTAGDPAGLPDHDPEWDFGKVVIHFDNGGTVQLFTDRGFNYQNPDEPDEPEGTADDQRG